MGVLFAANFDTNDHSKIFRDTIAGTHTAPYSNGMNSVVPLSLTKGGNVDAKAYKEKGPVSPDKSSVARFVWPATNGVTVVKLNL